MVIDEKKIESLVRHTFVPGPGEVASILERAEKGRGIELEEAAVLLAAQDPADVRMIHERAGELKERLFGKRVVLFAPLYLSNHCSNGCLYCGFRAGNTGVSRKALTEDEIVSEARALEGMGFKRVLLVTGEDPSPSRGLDYIVSAVRAIYKKTAMRIVHVNAPPMGVDELRELKASGAGVYQAFQETYHRPTYEKMHPFGRKRDFDYRLTVMDRALEAGFNDVGIGPLFGLFDMRFDTLATIAHSEHLRREFRTHAHTISIPRLRPAEGSGLDTVPFNVSDSELKKAVSIFRLSVPSAGVVVSTRESAELRAELIHAGASQLSAASRTSPGGYSAEKSTLEQFTTSDNRSLQEVMQTIMAEGFVPSLCTSCYRSGRVGEDFTERTVSGGMEGFCNANATLTLKEYFEEHGTNGMKASIEELIRESVGRIKDPAMKKAVTERLERLERGERDLFF